MLKEAEGGEVFYLKEVEMNTLGGGFFLRGLSIEGDTEFFFAESILKTYPQNLFSVEPTFRYREIEILRPE